MKFLWKQDVVKSTDELKNMHVHTMSDIYKISVLLLLVCVSLTIIDFC